MATRIKTFVPDQIYFLTFTILGWQRVFTGRKYVDLVYKWFDYTREKYQNKIHGYVAMPNHIHCLIYISNQSPVLARIVQNAKRFMAYQIVALLENEKKIDLLNYFKKEANTEKGAKHKMFQDRYDSKMITSQEMFIEKLNYIHNNPCQEKWGLTCEIEDYPYSSARNYLVPEKAIYKEVEVLL